jgi:uncharacterized repeat protein (TIGR03803 family)
LLLFSKRSAFPCSFLKKRTKKLLFIWPSFPVEASDSNVLSREFQVRFPWQPLGSLLRTHDGKLYGTTLQGGADNQGTIFEITPDGREKVLHSFTNGADGGWPYAGLTAGPDGTLFGTASKGGASGAGVVFAITP